MQTLSVSLVAARNTYASPFSITALMVVVLCYVSLGIFAPALYAADCSAPPAPAVDWSGCDKSNTNLAGVDLSGATLIGTDFSGADLSGAILFQADLTGADLSEAVLFFASVQQATLSYADLTEADLSFAFLVGADLSHAILTDTNLFRATFTSATLAGATGFPSTTVNAKWLFTICPDGTLSSDHGNTCDGHFLPATPPDLDGDGVADDMDACLDTRLPEDVPTVRLGTNRFADVDGDGVFDTASPQGQGPQKAFTLVHTAGCSCAQIIAQLGLGAGHTKFGCSISAMEEWIALMN